MSGFAMLFQLSVGGLFTARKSIPQITYIQ